MGDELSLEDIDEGEELDEIVALRGEVSTLAATCDAQDMALTDLQRDLEAYRGARAECERQYQQMLQEALGQVHRAERAEDEVERLKAALESFARQGSNLEPFDDGHLFFLSKGEIMEARAALSGQGSGARDALVEGVVSNDMPTCVDCGGSGVVIMPIDAVRSKSIPCPNCQGHGSRAKETAPSCRNSEAWGWPEAGAGARDAVVEGENMGCKNCIELERERDSEAAKAEGWFQRYNEVQIERERLRAALGAWERWEADILLEPGCWREEDGLPHITQELWDRVIELQEMRSAALARLEGEDG